MEHTIQQIGYTILLLFKNLTQIKGGHEIQVINVIPHKT